jgi:thioredoxin-like negative regulator of GroEL
MTNASLTGQFHQQRLFSSGPASVMIEIDTNEGWEAMMKVEKPIVLQVSASWCRPCQVLKPMLETGIQKTDGECLFYYLDVDKMGNVA